MEHTVLVVEDEKGIRESLKLFLKSHNYEFVEAENGEEALKKLSPEIHLAIVDIMMPVMDGMTFVSRLRESYDFPVIFLSAKDEDIDKITGLNMGADDYVTKPFEPLELMARVNAHLRRYEKFLNQPTVTKNDKQYLVVGNLKLDLYSREVNVNNQMVHLTKKEFEILKLLMESPGRVYSAEEIYERVWSQDAINTETIMVHVRKLREKIEQDPKHPQYLKVVWGIGYKIEKL